MSFNALGRSGESGSALLVNGVLSRAPDRLYTVSGDRPGDTGPSR